MKRFRIIGRYQEVSGWGTFVPEYVDATDRDDAIGRAGFWYERVDEIREVPWNEGRGLIWRLWNWLRRRRAG